MGRRPKKVLIIGGGPSGLVAAKTLLRSYPDAFDVTIVEKAKTLGGLWPMSVDTKNGLVSPEMPTNMSKHSVCFSDLAWESVNLGKGPPHVDDRESREHDGGRDSSIVSLFPKAWQEGKYLEAYVKKFIPEGCITLESRVTKAVRGKYGNGYRWKVDWIGPRKHDEVLPQAEVPSREEYFREKSFKQDFFDYLIVATGFFCSPRIGNTPGLKQIHGNGRILHTSKLRNINDLLNPKDSSNHNHETPETPKPINSDDVKENLPKLSSILRQSNISESSSAALSKHGNKIVVIGGGMSGAEAAASLAFQISSSRHSPSPSSDCASFMVYHIITRPFYCLPPLLPKDPVNSDKRQGKAQISNPAPTFLPLDLCMYDLSRRADGPIMAFSGKMSAERAKMSHSYLQTMIGGDQSNLHVPPLAFSRETMEKPPYVVISSSYTEFVREGIIIPITGRATAISVDEEDTGTVTYNTDVEQETLLDSVAAVVLATGYSPHSAIAWLPRDILETLQFDPECSRMPLILPKNSQAHAEVPDLGFVGFYEGPYWGIMEMQARTIARRWAYQSGFDQVGVGGYCSSNPLPSSEPEGMRELLHMLQLRKDIYGSDMIPQFWMGDYVGTMEDFARELGIQRNRLNGFEDVAGPAVGSRYTMEADDKEEAAKALRDLDNTLTSSAKHGAFVARAVFRAMQGPWVLERSLISQMPSYPSGQFKGTASFHPREPTEDRYDAEYLYIESGEYVSEQGLRMSSSRRYIYRYCEKTDKITAWFVKADDGKRVDYFFHELEFVLPDHNEERGPMIEGWSAKGDHLCADDKYDAEYMFRFRGVGLERFGVKYKVKGPKKDYVSNSWYKRG
ncbi:MAG: hypothetical protein M1827_006897 [Pycnora praestabilis]|nr:MAG: hypothetical protein M1827_006897 [Pycnora praestabilis]